MFIYLHRYVLVLTLLFFVGACNQAQIVIYPSTNIQTEELKILNITDINGAGAFRESSVIKLNLKFNRPVTVTGAPFLILNSLPQVFAHYASGSGTANLIFEYTVNSGENFDLTYSLIKNLDLNGGEIKDTSGNAASLEIPLIGALNTIKIDTIAPDAVTDLEWLETSPTANININASWKKSSSNDILNQVIEIFDDSNCSNPIDGPFDIILDEQYSYKGKINQSYYYKISTFDVAKNQTDSTCSALMEVASDSIPPDDATSLDWTNSNPSELNLITATWTISQSEDLDSQLIDFYMDANCTVPLTLAIPLDNKTSQYSISSLFGSSNSYKITSIDFSANSSVTNCSSYLEIKSSYAIVTSQSISVGSHHACAILNNSVFCWGANRWGQLGIGTTTDSYIPVEVIELRNKGVKAIDAGGNHTCAIARETVYCWGLNSDGQLGDGTTIDRLIPKLVSSIGDASMIAAGDTHTCAVVNGAAKCWGKNDYGQLGDGSTTNSSSPVQVLGLSSNVSKVASGEEHSCAIKNGSAFCWGRNQSGQLGNGTFSNSNQFVQVTGLSSGVTDISAGLAHTCAIQNAGGQCWGSNSDGQIGNASALSHFSTPQSVVNYNWGFTMISSGHKHSCAIGYGMAHCWGNNDYGQIGINHTSIMNYPKPCVDSSGNNLVRNFEISSGGNSSCGIFGDSGLLCWGSNDYGQVGRNPSEATTFLVPTGGTGAKNSITTLVGGSHNFCSLIKGKIQCWGDRYYGGVGVVTPNANFTGTPEEVSGDLEIFEATKFSSFRNHSCASSNGKILCWGDNLSGQSGRDPSVPSDVFLELATTIPGLIGIDVKVGTLHSCAINQYSEVKCWGDNFYGQLGTGNTTQTYHNPQFVKKDVSTNLIGVEKLALGSVFSCALVDGKVWCWGRNNSGQLGDASVVQRNYPVSVKTDATGTTELNGVTDIIAGGEHACALSNGEVWCWGDNTYGQLGRNSIGSYSSYAQKVVKQSSALSGVLQIISGHDFSCATAQNAINCWGNNSFGQLADGTTNNRGYAEPVYTLAPTVLAGIQLAGASNQAVCVIANGKPWCWGDYLGIGQVNKSPVQFTGMMP